MAIALLVLPLGQGNSGVSSVGKEALLVGDSVAAVLNTSDVGLALLGRKHPFIMRAKGCQRIDSFGCTKGSRDSSLRILKKERGKFSRAVIVATGYNENNGANFERSVRAVCAEASLQGVDVIWLTYKVGGNVKQKSRDFNQTLFQLARSIDGLVILDWNSISAGHPEYFTDDGVHMNGIGGIEMARAISGALDRLPAVETTTTTVAPSN